LPPRLGQRDHHRPTVVAGSIPHHETGRLGTGDPLRYRSGGDEAALGDLPRGELVWRATTAQGAQQVEGRTVSAEALQGPASLVGEQLRQPPDPGDDPDRLDRHVRQLAAPRRLNPIGAVLVPCCHAAQPALRLVTPINLALKEFAWLHGPSSSPGAEPASAAPSRSRSPPTATPSSSPAGDGNDSSEPSPRSDRPYGRSTSTRRTRWPSKRQPSTCLNASTSWSTRQGATPASTSPPRHPTTWPASPLPGEPISTPTSSAPS